VTVRVSAAWPQVSALVHASKTSKDGVPYTEGVDVVPSLCDMVHCALTTSDAHVHLLLVGCDTERIARHILEALRKRSDLAGPALAERVWVLATTTTWPGDLTPLLLAPYAQYALRPSPGCAGRAGTVATAMTAYEDEVVRARPITLPGASVPAAARWCRPLPEGGVGVLTHAPAGGATCAGQAAAAVEGLLGGLQAGAAGALQWSQPRGAPPDGYELRLCTHSSRCGGAAPVGSCRGCLKSRLRISARLPMQSLRSAWLPMQSL
jgi:hypothetical protein